MIRTLLLTTLLLLLAIVAEAGACVCVARSPQERMADADAAFIGTVTAVRREDRRRVYTVAVEQAYKGDVGTTVEVRGGDPESGAITSCDEVYAVGDELGGYFSGPPADWTIFTCNRATREDLEQGAEGFPAPSGDGLAVALRAGPFASSPFRAVDRHGSVIAYARGRSDLRPVVLAVCPGGRYVAELSAGRFATRRISDLRVVRRHGRGAATALACADRRGRRLIVRDDRGRLLAVRGSARRRLARVPRGVRLRRAARTVRLPRPVRVRDASRFNPGPSASAGSRPRARRARAAGDAPPGGCPTA